MLLSNKLIYGNRLRCGSEEVARQSLVLPNRSFLQKMHTGSQSCSGEDCWIEKLMAERYCVISPRFYDELAADNDIVSSCKAVFVDTDLVPCRDSRVGDLVQNEGEATIVYQITETLIRCGIEPSQLGIISLYRQQNKLLSQKLKSHSGIEILTADKSQGRDKDCIIISLVRSNETGNVGDLVKDWRRMNVSFTRARSKVIIIGSRKTLKGAELLREFFGLMEEQKWILQLPAGADVAHSEVFVQLPASPGVKRNAGDCDGVRKENDLGGSPRPHKKQKKADADALLRGRPILQDLVNDTK
ncbi:DNA replication endonuclease-helicase Dna2 [Marasmius crinis-equi]|uniref:DNA replication endonuclease-helicase Dna2 n=1 Tax=Marasmius crinis-equi TaxID=585013 RepID=A0ABR3ETU1_9AGAR